MATDHSPARPSSARADADEVEAHRPGRWRWAHEWNRAYLLTCAAGLIVDPLFLYTLSVSGPMMCLFVDGWFALTVTVLRCMIDALHVWNAGLKLWVGLRRGPHQQQPAEEERPKEKHKGYSLESRKGLFLDLFVILPFMQVVLWVAAPALIRKGSTTTVMIVFLVTFLFQYLPKIYHSVRFLRRMQNFSGYIFGTIWWGIALNLIAYFVASHSRIGSGMFRFRPKDSLLLSSISSNGPRPKL